MNHLRRKKIVAVSWPRKGNDAPKFVAQRDIPECGILSGDVIVAPTDGGARLLRRLDLHAGRLYTLAIECAIMEIRPPHAAGATTLSLVRTGA